MLLVARRLFDGTNPSLLMEPVIDVRDGVVVGITNAGRVPDSATEVVDLGDVTVLPGLIDVHQHLAFDASADPVKALQSDSDEMLLLRMRLAAQRALSAGITTIRDLGDRNYLSVTLRDWFRLGHEAGPDILAAGPPVTTPGGHCWFMGGEAGGVDGVRTAVRDHAARGVDVIKVMATGGDLSAGSAPQDCQYGAEELAALVQEAHGLGLPVAAHAHGTAGIAASMHAGVDTIEHCTFWTAEGVDRPTELIAELGRRRAFVSATGGFLPGMRPGSPAVEARSSAIIANLAALHLAGARLLLGTDAGIAASKPHNVLPYAVVSLAAALGPLEALRTVTATAAEACGVADRKGTVALGKDADLLVVSGNPLEDVTCLHSVVAVFARGRRAPTSSGKVPTSAGSSGG